MRRVLFLLLVIVSWVYSATYEEWIEEFKKDALKQGITQQTLDKAFVDIKFLDKNIELDRKQPHKTLTYNEYKSKVLSDARISEGRQKIKENQELLTKISKEYRIDKSVIVALWGLETSYGKLGGKNEIISSLATLAYEGRRGEFFRQELINALKMLQSYNIDKNEFVGSWAGAMGQCQFMPTSYLLYAVDYNKDNKADIWNTQSDVFASIANYLRQNNYKYHQPITVQVKLSKQLDDNMLDKSVVKSIVEWQKLGVYPIQTMDKNLKGYIKYADSTKKEIFMHFDNYKVISKWNRSSYFVHTVSLLSQSLK